MKTSLIIPCFNEEKGLAFILENIPSFIDEVIVVDNNSTDNTAGVAARYSAKVVFEKRKGYGQAYLAGFENASGDVIITMDGDGSYALKDVKKMLVHVSSGKADFVSGCRFPLSDKQAMNISNQFGNHVLTLFFNFLIRGRIKDSQSGMWVFRKSILEKIKLESSGMPFSEEIKMEAIVNKHIVFLEVPIDYSERFGETKLRKVRDGLFNLLYLFVKRLRISTR